MEKKKFSKRDIEPKMLKIAGEEYPAICSMEAIDDMETETGIPYARIMNDLMNEKFTTKEVVAVTVACLRAGGTEIEAADLRSMVHGFEYVSLVEKLCNIMIAGAPMDEKKGKGSSKNATK